MAKIQAVWALDVGQAALKALKLVPAEPAEKGEASTKVVAEAFDYIEYPKILSQPDADPDELVREALMTFLERNDVKGCKVSIAVPGQAGLVKFIKLPPVEKKRIPDIVKFEARQQIPFALEEVIWDYQEIGEKDEGDDDDFTMAEVGLFAMKRDQISRAILPFTVAGIEVDLVQMGPIALYNFLNFDRMGGPEKAKGSIVLIDIGADNTDLIISDGTRIWQRNVPIGGNHFTRGLTKELKLTFAKGEHLKRNATKAPDPRAVFTAMRGVFNDLASEINRSIGFYSSVNRTAKIARVIGLGNGFKLPGLQKFLQQNLNMEVEKLEVFERMSGDEVITAPQFQENLPSFAVAYGLGAQGLGLSQLRTNLLPPEIIQIRMIRRKKPWALAASVILMLGFLTLFLGDLKLWAKVNDPILQSAAKQAKDVAEKGAGFRTDFETAKTEWQGQKDVGDALVVDTSEQARWPAFLSTLSRFLPNMGRDFGLNPNNPKDQPKLDKLRVHIDAIKPVYRADLNTEWFSVISDTPGANSAGLNDMAKRLMHAYDRGHPPEGSGWVVQLIGHHYNPNPVRVAGKAPEPEDEGPLVYLARRVLPRLWHPELRSFGVSHATVTYLVKDDKWTNQKETSSNGLASNVPLLPRATPPVALSMDGMEGGMDDGYGGGEDMMYGGGGMGGGGYGMGGEESGMYGGGMGGGYGGFGMRPDAEKDLKLQTRTDFVIQLAWKPLTAEDTPTDPKEIAALLTEAQNTAGSGAIRYDQVEQAIENASKTASKSAVNRARQAREARRKAAAAGAAPGAPTTPAEPGAAPATPPVPGPG